MASFLDLLDAVAHVVGGTVSSSDPRFFSGQLAHDATGIQAPAGDPPFRGCWSVPPDTLEATPIAVLESDSFTAEFRAQGVEKNVDRLRLWVVTGRADAKTSMRVAVPYRDLVPAAFRASMTASRGNPGTPSTQLITYCFPIAGQMRVVTWGGTEYLGWDFTLELFRAPVVGYTL